MAPIIELHHNQPTVRQPTFVMQSYVNAILQAGDSVLIPSLIDGDGWDALYSRLDGILSAVAETSPRNSPGDPHPASMMWTRRVIPLNENGSSCCVRWQTFPRHLPRLPGPKRWVRWDSLYSLPDQLPNALDNLSGTCGPCSFTKSNRGGYHIAEVR